MSYFPPFSRTQFDRLGGSAEPNAIVTGAARQLGSAEGRIAPPGSVVLTLLDDTGGTVELQGSTDAATWYTVASGTNTANTPFELQAPVVFRYYRANITYAASGATISYLAVGNAGNYTVTQKTTEDNAYTEQLDVASLTRAIYLQGMSTTAPTPVLGNNTPDDINNAGINSGLAAVTLAAETPPYFDFVLPYCVLIGESTAKGNVEPSVYPNPSSRLQDSAGALVYDPTHQDVIGQPGYHLAERLNIPVLNQGIGGQTTAQVLARWNRDVLGQTVAVGDTLPNTTIDWTLTQANLRSKTPALVVLLVGKNDVGNNVAQATTQANFEAFAQSAIANRFNLVVCTIGQSLTWSDAQAQNAFEINEWLKGTYAETYKDRVQVVAVDQWETQNNGQTFADLKTRGQAPAFGGSSTGYQPGLTGAQNVHPYPTGYASLADYIAGQVRFPCSLARLGFELGVNLTAQPNYSYIDTATFLGATLSRDTANSAYYITHRMGKLPVANYSDPIARLEVLTSSVHTGTGVNLGISAANATLLRPQFAQLAEEAAAEEETKALFQYPSTQNVYTNLVLGNSIAAVAPGGHNRIVLYHMPVWETKTYTAIYIDITTAVAGQTVYLGVAEIDPATGLPLTVVSASSAIDASTTGIKAGTISAPLDKSRQYALAFTCSAGGSGILCRGVGSGTRWAIGVNPATFNTNYAWQADYDAGTLPATLANVITNALVPVQFGYI